MSTRCSPTSIAPPAPPSTLAATLRDLGERAAQTALALVPAVLKTAIRLALRTLERECDRDR